MIYECTGSVAVSGEVKTERGDRGGFFFVFAAKLYCSVFVFVFFLLLGFHENYLIK